jgi:hypothetical protein
MCWDITQCRVLIPYQPLRDNLSVPSYSVITTTRCVVTQKSTVRVTPDVLTCVVRIRVLVDLCAGMVANSECRQTVTVSLRCCLICVCRTRDWGSSASIITRLDDGQLENWGTHWVGCGGIFP